MRSRILEAIAAALISTSVLAGEEGVEIPAVPVKVVRKTPSAVPVAKGSDILVNPGASVVIPIAYGHLNRILTPFENPRVRTVSNAQIQVHDKVVYVATEETKPITLFITPADRESPALSLILAPRQIPPREVRIRLPKEAEKALRFQDTVRKMPSGRDMPHVANVKAIMKALARGRIPTGFAMRDLEPNDRVGCFQEGLVAVVGQVMDGPGMVLRVAAVRNTAAHEVELDEERCTAPGTTVAVAAWPRVRLAPGDQVELYVLSREEAAPSESVRPFLIGGGS